MSIEEPKRLIVRGVGRDAEHPSGRFLFVALNRRPTDDELRAIHELLRELRL